MLEIIERLAHAHHHDVGQHPPIGRILRRILVFVVQHCDAAAHIAFGPFAQRIARQHDLADNLARRQIAHQTHRAGMAETAVQRAADLTRHAQRSPIRIGNEHHLIILPVVGPQQPFASAIVGHLRFYHLRAADDETLGHPAAHRLGEVRHRVEIGLAAMIEPVEQLFGAQFGRFHVQPCLLQHGLDLRARQAEQVGAAIRAGRDGAGHGHRIDEAGNRHDKVGG